MTGIYAAQLAALSGLRVLAVASPSNFDYLRSVGVSACVDRFTNPDDLLAEISNITQGKLAYAIDCVGSKTATLCHAALDNGGQLVALAGNPKPEPSSKDVTVHKISFSTTVSLPCIPSAIQVLMIRSPRSVLSSTAYPSSPGPFLTSSIICSKMVVFSLSVQNSSPTASLVSVRASKPFVTELRRVRKSSSCASQTLHRQTLHTSVCAPSFHGTGSCEERKGHVD